MMLFAQQGMPSLFSLAGNHVTERCKEYDYQILRFQPFHQIDAGNGDIVHLGSSFA
jgi:hypothetical protein